MIAFDEKKYQEALEWVEKALEVNPREPYYYNNRGLYRMFLGNLEGGIEDINYSLKQDSKNLVALRNKGIYYTKKGQKEMALSYLNDVYAKDPDMDLLQEYLAIAQTL
jgi:tetratricopeptide (TPR) repeat protein